MTAAIYEQRILPPKKATVLERRAFRIDEQSDGLRASAVRILKRHILSAEIICVDERRKREPGVACFLRAQPEGNDGFLRVLAAESNEAFTRAYTQLLLIQTRFDLN